MALRLSEHPERDRPRERLWSVGPAALTGQELLAILLGTGYAGRDALAVAGEVLARVEGSLRRLAGRTSRACRVSAAAKPPAWSRRSSWGAAWEPRRSRPPSGSGVRQTCSGSMLPGSGIWRWRNFTCWPSAARVRCWAI